MPSQLENASPLFINVRKWVVQCSLRVLHLILLKLKFKVGMPHRVNLTSYKKLSSLENPIVKLALL